MYTVKNFSGLRYQAEEARRFTLAQKEYLGALYKSSSLTLRTAYTIRRGLGGARPPGPGGPHVHAHAHVRLFAY